MAQAETDLTSKYEVRQQIGKGSFGSAFLVTNKQDKKDYVLKRVRLAKQTKWQRNSTLQERDLVSTLRHPFIVPCVESWMVQGHTVNMIYGYCEKGDLSSYLQRVQRVRGQVEEPLMMKWLCQLLLALDYLQTMRVLHRDIKTSNLLLTCDMDVQLGDFGLATHMQDAGDGSKPEDTNLVGTPHYMSPELLSCKDYGFKTDVWSLGCVFYELTAQRPTFNAFNIHGLVSKIRKNKLAPLPDSYSEAWREVIHLMLCKNPERRPSVQDLMGLPVLRPTLLEARARAQQIMPGVKLPPLLDPTPLVRLPRRLSDASGTPVAQGPTPDAVTPEASTPDMFAAARAAATCFKGGSATVEEESPLLWGAPAAAGRQNSSTDRQDGLQQGSGEQAAIGSTALSADSPTCSIDTAAPATGRVQGRGKDAAADAGLAISQPARGGDGPLQASGSSSLQPLGSSERQRLELLESVMQVMSGLYARGRWQELGSVLSSPGLLQDSMQAAVHAAASQLPSSQRCSPAAHAAQPGSRRAGAGSRTSSGQLGGAAQPAEVQHPALKLGDVVVLGKSKAVKGKIRYIGPVAWGAAGEDWVGMELDSACGMDGTLHGITYIDCAPRCASFHKASQLTSM
ncbi:hypothetical protein OEZ86_012732 [Tetradesmus obliquus]|nr:hypothetical protein OEZ86_012732 [Tetradesmus obliquus]